VKLDWPSLSPELWTRAIRVAHLCGIHQTLARQVEIAVDAENAVAPAIERTVDLAARGMRRTGEVAAPQVDVPPRASSAP